ncbi:MAG: hypothetical protein H6738_18405 [Alphaproteobacteria bacterium]|nr:hypothetical protein [Alphaproteobacteria bacterium]
MARSLVVKHEENPRTSPLFTGFLLLCGGFLLLGTAMAAADGDIDPGPSLTEAALP